MKKLLAFAIAIMMVVAMVPVCVSANTGGGAGAAPTSNYFAFMFMKRLLTEYAVELVYDETMGTVVIDDEDASVRFANDVLVTVAANEGYLVETVTVNGEAVELDEAGCFTIENVKNDKLIEATFIADPDYVPAEEEVVEEEVVEEEVVEEEIVEEEIVDEEVVDEVVADEEIADEEVVEEKVEETVADAE